jgi:hypothetical protein
MNTDEATYIRDSVADIMLLTRVGAHSQNNMEKVIFTEVHDKLLNLRNHMDREIKESKDRSTE